MKKIIMLVVCLTMMGIQSVKAQAAIAALHHEGNVTIYSTAQSAIDNSVDGDTIYLSEGAFGGFTVNKGIAVIGSGMKTRVAPDISIEGVNVILSNLALVNDLVIGSDVARVKVRQCKISGNCIFGNLGVSDVEILMCHINGNMSLNENTDNVSIINSKIGIVDTSGSAVGSVNFVNCNIKTLASNDNIFINCIISSDFLGGYLNNCLIYNVMGYNDYSINSDCYYNDSFTLDNNFDCSFSDQNLLDLKYLGTDGTVVGITGGATPYTLASPVLRITDHNIEVDNEQRKLKVTLTLGTEE